MALRSARIHNVKSLLRGYKTGDKQHLEDARSQMELMDAIAIVKKSLGEGWKPSKELGAKYDKEGRRVPTQKEQLRHFNEGTTMTLLTSKPGRWDPSFEFSSKQKFKKQDPQDTKKFIKQKKKLRFKPAQVITMGAYR